MNAGIEITRTRWLMLEAALAKGTASAIQFRYKDHLIVVRRYDMDSDALAPFFIHIDGELVYEAVKDERATPIMRELWRKHTKPVWTAAERMRIAKAHGGFEQAREKYRNFDKITVTWRPGFTTAKGAISKLAKLPGVRLLEVVDEKRSAQA